MMNDSTITSLKTKCFLAVGDVIFVNVCATLS